MQQTGQIPNVPPRSTTTSNQPSTHCSVQATNSSFGAVHVVGGCVNYFAWMNVSSAICMLHRIISTECPVLFTGIIGAVQDQIGTFFRDIANKPSDLTPAKGISLLQFVLLVYATITNKM